VAKKEKKPAKEKKVKEVPAKLSRTPVKSDVESPEKEEEVLEDTGEESDEDYLLQYQYGRELPLGDIRSNPKGGKAEAMKKNLLSQKKIRMLIPAEAGSDQKVPMSVTLNGYRLDLPKNVYIDVPEQVAEIILSSQKQTDAALSQFKFKEPPRE